MQSGAVPISTISIWFRVSTRRLSCDVVCWEGCDVVCWCVGVFGEVVMWVMWYVRGIAFQLGSGSALKSCYEFVGRFDMWCIGVVGVVEDDDGGDDDQDGGVGGTGVRWIMIPSRASWCRWQWLKTTRGGRPSSIPLYTPRTMYHQIRNSPSSAELDLDMWNVLLRNVCIRTERFLFPCVRHSALLDCNEMCFGCVLFLRFGWVANVFVDVRCGDAIKSRLGAPHSKPFRQSQFRLLSGIGPVLFRPSTCIRTRRLEPETPSFTLLLLYLFEFRRVKSGDQDSGHGTHYKTHTHKFKPDRDVTSLQNTHTHTFKG
eukprot:1174264-Amorphochlora_amoeboformis.AAC.1